jgi:hypothetical protein
MTNCPESENLNRVYESKLTKYLPARSALLYRISTEFATKQQVDMERAKSDMEEHLLICPSVMVCRVSQRRPPIPPTGSSDTSLC